MVKVKWAEFKTFVDAKGLSIQYFEYADRYWLYAFDGPFYLWCRLRTEDPAEANLVDFETNYKPSGNASPKTEAVTQFEKTNITLKMCTQKKVTSSQSVTMDFKVPGTYNVDAGRKLRSGQAWFASPHADDKITGVSVIDIDNVTGLGAGAVLKVYQDSDVTNYQDGGWYLGEAKAEVEAIVGVASIPAGVYLRVEAEKGGASEDDLYVNIRWGEVE